MPNHRFQLRWKRPGFARLRRSVLTYKQLFFFEHPSFLCNKEPHTHTHAHIHTHTHPHTYTYTTFLHKTHTHTHTYVHIRVRGGSIAAFLFTHRYGACLYLLQRTLHQRPQALVPGSSESERKSEDESESESTSKCETSVAASGALSVPSSFCVGLGVSDIAHEHRGLPSTYVCTTNTGDYMYVPRTVNTWRQSRGTTPSEPPPLPSHAHSRVNKSKANITACECVCIYSSSSLITVTTVHVILGGFGGTTNARTNSGRPAGSSFVLEIVLGSFAHTR
jgi:hypothetical protein